MAETAFGVTYDGPALAQGRMPVRDLAPALLALGDLFADASALLYPERKPVALNIQATQEGSFVIDLILEAERAWDQLVDIFGSDGAAAIVNLKEIVIGGGFGLFWLIKQLRGRTIRAQHVAPTPGRMRLELDDDTALEVATDVMRLYSTITIRKKTREVVEPLTRPGVEALEFRSEEEITLIVESGDVEAFEFDVEYLPLLDHELEMVVAIASVAFTEGNKWRFTDGERTFYAAIEDKVFVSRIESGIESFRKGDMLRCRMRIVQTQSEDGLHTEYRVLEVLQHIPRPTQLRFGEGPGEPPDHS